MRDSDVGVRVDFLMQKSDRRTHKTVKRERSKHDATCAVVGWAGDDSVAADVV